MLKTSQGALAAAIDELREAEQAVQALTAQNAAAAERAAEIRAEVREAKVAHEQAIAALKSVQAQFAVGSASREAVAKARRAVETSERVQLDAEELVTALEGAMKGRPAEIAAAGNRVTSAKQKFRRQLYEHLVVAEAPAGLSEWLSRVLALGQVCEASADTALVMRTILTKHEVRYADRPTGDALTAAAEKIEREFLGAEETLE